MKEFFSDLFDDFMAASNQEKFAMGVVTVIVVVVLYVVGRSIFG